MKNSVLAWLVLFSLSCLACSQDPSTPSQTNGDVGGHSGEGGAASGGGNSGATGGSVAGGSGGSGGSVSAGAAGTIGWADQQNGTPVSVSVGPNPANFTVDSPGLPDGRRYYVLSMMGGVSTTSRWSILRTYEFSGYNTESGSVVAASWVWAQDKFTGDATENKIDTGYTTCGGEYCGVVRTPVGFEPGSMGAELIGDYYLDSNGRINITWPSGKNEIWSISSPKPYSYSMITIFHSNYNVSHGWGFGSNTPLLGVGATIDDIKNRGNLSFQDQWYNGYDIADTQSVTYMAISNHSVCSSVAMMNRETNIPLVCDRWHSYIAGDPSVDSRKNYWNQQLGEVGCEDAYYPQQCPIDNCAQYVISPGGGHTFAMLQVLDDEGVFRGFVAAEASLDHRSSGGAIVGASYWMQP